MRITAKVVRDDRFWKRMHKRLLKGNGQTVSVGWFSGRHPSGESLAQIAAWNEEGHYTSRGAYSPPRPFLTVGFMKKVRSKNFIKQYLYKIDAIAKGKYTWEKLGKELSENLKTMLKQEILDWKIPGNSPYTILLKGFDDPLIETGTMYDRIQTRRSRGKL